MRTRPSQNGCFYLLQQAQRVDSQVVIKSFLLKVGYENSLSVYSYDHGKAEELTTHYQLSLNPSRHLVLESSEKGTFEQDLVKVCAEIKSPTFIAISDRGNEWRDNFLDIIA